MNAFKIRFARNIPMFFIGSFVALVCAATSAQNLTVSPTSVDFGTTDQQSGQYLTATRRVYPTRTVTFTNNTTSTVNLISLNAGASASAANNPTARFTTSGTCYTSNATDAPLRSSLAPNASCTIEVTPNIDVLLSGLPSLGGYIVNDAIWLTTSSGQVIFTVRAGVGNDLRFFTFNSGALQAHPVVVGLSPKDNPVDGSDTKETTFVNPFITAIPHTSTYTDTLNFIYVPAPFVRAGGTCPTVLPAVASAGCTIGFTAPYNINGPFGSTPVFGTAVVGFARSNRAVDLILVRSLQTSDSDLDNDGIPYAVELAEGRDPFNKDNAIFTGTHPSNANRWFAMQQYRDFLSREADTAGLAGWTNLLNTSLSREAVIQGFFGSPEFQSGVPSVVRLYLGFFKRIPDSAGLKGWVTAVRAGAPLGTVASAFAQSAEFQLTYGALTNAQFVTLVYQNVLGRAPDTAGYNGWLALLQGGMSRGDMMVGFTESTEYQLKTSPNVFVIMMYEGMLRRAAEQAGYDYWVNYVNSGKDALDLTRGFLNSNEYRNRFLP